MKPAEFYSAPFFFSSNLLRFAALLAASVLPTTQAFAAGPRWVTGSPYFGAVPAGRPVVWSTTQLGYSTDPGDLSASVNHASADAIVSAAASVWDVPNSAVVLTQGGTLAEDVSGGNTSVSAGQPVFPTDVQASNYAAIPIAVVYDSDGAITDLLLGSGSSDPTNCRQNGVTERVDSITPFGYIQHAVLIINGRCSGTAPEQQLQLQYQLERAFGRILGLGWSQLNDNVYTDSRNATDTQKQHWPIMHPIDLTCGAYSYQCLPQPFTLRDDDVASISSLYPVAMPAPSGKVPTWQNAARITGTTSFPTGEGMQGVNVVVRRGSQDYQDVSSVSGFLFQQNGGNPVTGPASSISDSQGSTDATLQGYYDLAWVPEMDLSGSMPVTITTEAVNPLYIGAYAVGPYVPGAVTPSGSAQSTTVSAGVYDGSHPLVVNFAPPDAASNCATADGTETAPSPVPSTGIWTGLLCGRGHSAWSSASLAANRTATVEVTALDESGAATTSKAMPLAGVWASTDLPGSLPTLAHTQSAFNTIAFGVSAARLYTSQARTIRFAVADQRGDGRPDFAYSARLLYAAAVQPATVPLSGGPITITGTGFTSGLQVRINGAAAPVVQSTSTFLVVSAPVAAFASTVDIAITDPATGGSSSMYSALTYSTTAQPNRVVLISAPSGTVTAGTTAPGAFAVRALQPDGTTAAPGTAVTFSVSSGAAQLNACGATSCIIVTDASGNASTLVTPTAAGTIAVVASIPGSTQSISFNAAARALTALPPVEYVAAGQTVSWPAMVSATQNAVAAPGVLVTWAGSGTLSFANSTTITDTSGTAQSTAAATLASGAAATSQACAWTTVCTAITAIGVDPANWRVQLVSGSGQTIPSGSTFAPVIVRIVDTAGHSVAGAPVAIHQTITAGTMACPARGACPIAPTLDVSVTSATSDSEGLLSVTPMQLATTAGTTNIVVATGTQGFLQLALQQLP